MANSQFQLLASTITRDASSPDQNYFIGRLKALETLLKAMNEEAAAYQQLIRDYGNQALVVSKNQEDPQLIEQVHSLIGEWYERVKHDLDALKADINAYLNRVKSALASAEIDEVSRAGFAGQIDALIQLCGDDLAKSTTTDSIVRLDASRLTSSRLTISRLTNSHVRRNADEHQKDADDLLKEFATLRENRLTALQALEKLRQAQKSVLEKESEKKFKNYTYADAKKGGANLSGELGGWYTNDATPTQRSLIKKEDAIEKVMGEYLAGTILSTIYQSLKTVPNGRYAIVSLIRPIVADKRDKSGKDVYLKSDCIPNYKKDLWEEAWDENEGGKQPESRPSGLFKPASLKWTDAFIVDKKLLAEFADLAAPRLLLGDFGLHNGNFGVANNTDPGKVHLAALDYGAAFYNFSQPLAPYLPFTGRDFYKNHFRDYGTRVNASEAMAKAFIKLGSMPSNLIEKALNEGLDKVCKFYDKNALQQFCNRLGMGAIPDYADDTLTKQMVATYVMGKIKERQQALKNHGYALLLEHCIIKNDEDRVVIDIKKLRRHLNSYKGLTSFVQTNFFNDYSLVYHNARSGWMAHAPRIITDRMRRNEDNELKYALMQGIIDARTTEQDTLTYQKNHSFMSRHIKTILLIAGLWAFSGALVGALASTATAGLTLPFLALIGAVVGAIVGFGIGVVACLISQGDCNSRPERVDSQQSGEFVIPPSLTGPAFANEPRIVSSRSRKQVDTLKGSDHVRLHQPLPTADARAKGFRIVLNDENNDLKASSPAKPQ